MSLEGKILGDRYEILRRIGGGGMAVVYLARDRLLERQVAVKVMNESLSHDGDFVRRFDREAKAAASMSHPNVVNVYDVGRDGAVHYLVMEYMEGASLIDLIRERAPLPPDEAVAIMSQICEGLAHAHERGIVHRDIKPHNIMATVDGRYKLGDFGISRLSGASAITQTGFVMGSVHYFSPEQARGRDIGHQSDIYSLGVVLFYMVAGELPFDGEEAIAIALKHLQEPVPDPRRWNPDLPEGLCQTIARAMAKDPGERYFSAADMKSDLDRAFENDFIPAAEREPFSVPPAAGPVTGRTGLSETRSGRRAATTVPSRLEAGRTQAARRPRLKKRWMTVGAVFASVLLLFLIIQWNDSGKTQAQREDPGVKAGGGSAKDRQVSAGDKETGDPDGDESDQEKPEPKPEEESSRGAPAQPPQQEEPADTGHDWRQDIPAGGDNGTFSGFSKSGSGGSYQGNVGVKALPGEQVMYDVYVSDKNGPRAISQKNPVQVNGDGQNYVPVSFPVTSQMPDGNGIVKIRLYKVDAASGGEVDAVEHLLEQVGG